MTPTQDEAVAQALATAIKDGDRISDLLDELSRGRGRGRAGRYRTWWCP